MAHNTTSLSVRVPNEFKKLFLRYCKKNKLKPSAVMLEGVANRIGVIYTPAQFKFEGEKNATDNQN